MHLSIDAAACADLIAPSLSAFQACLADADSRCAALPAMMPRNVESTRELNDAKPRPSHALPNAGGVSAAANPRTMKVAPRCVRPGR